MVQHSENCTRAVCSVGGTFLIEISDSRCDATPSSTGGCSNDHSSRNPGPRSLSEFNPTFAGIAGQPRFSVAIEGQPTTGGGWHSIATTGSAAAEERMTSAED
jgi:hypothetical protein